MSQPLDKSEYEAVMRARQELGPDMEPALVESFAEKVVAEIRRQQADSQFTQHSLTPAKAARGGREVRNFGGYNPIALAVTSMVLAIPLTAIALGMGSTFMAVLSWVAIVVINVVAAWGANRNSR